MAAVGFDVGSRQWWRLMAAKDASGGVQRCGVWQHSGYPGGLEWPGLLGLVRLGMLRRLGVRGPIIVGLGFGI